MKKLIVTEAQYKMLQREGLEYTPEKIDEFVIEATQLLEKGKNMVRDFFNVVASTTIGEIIDDRKKYEEIVKKMYELQKDFENRYNRYYDIVNMYDFMDLPDNVSKLDKLVGEMDSVQSDLYMIQNRFDDIVEATDRLTDFSTTSQDEMGEQLLKGLKDKIKNVVAPKKDAEVTQVGRIPKQGRDIDQLRSEWSKVNANTADLRGFGEFTSPNESTAQTGAQMAAKRAIMKKMNKQEATFGSTIIDSAVFKLENGNYVHLVIIEPNNIK